MKKRKVTNPNPSPATRWKKGERPKGAGMKPGYLPRKELKEWTRASVAEAYKKYMNMRVEQLRDAAESLELPALEVIVARALLRDRLEGRMDNTEVILDRAIGRVPVHQMLSGPGETPLLPPQIVFEPAGKPTQEGMGETQ